MKDATREDPSRETMMRECTDDADEIVQAAIANPMTVWCPAPRTVSATQGGETVVLDVENEHYQVLDELGTRMWQLLSAGTTVRVIARTIQEEYQLPADVTLDHVVRDVTVLVARLAMAGLVTCDAPLQEEPNACVDHID